MAKYLLQGSYVGEGLTGILKEGGSKRREAAEQTVESVGGTIEAFYYAFGDDDFYIIMDLPDNVSAAALALKVGAPGRITVRTTVLLTPEEIDQATQKAVVYRPPGQ